MRSRSRPWLSYYYPLVGLSGGWSAPPESPGSGGMPRRPQPPPAAPAHMDGPGPGGRLERALETVPFVDAVMDECKLCRQQRLRDMGLGTKDQTTAISCSTARSSKRWRTFTARCASCTPSTPPRSRTAPCATTIAPLDEAPRKPPAARPATRSLQKGPSGTPGPEGRLPPAVHGLPSGDEPGPGGLHRLPRQERSRPQGQDPAGRQPDPLQVTQECLRCHKAAGEDMLKSAHWLWKGPSPYTLNHRKEVKSARRPLPPTTSE
jgi:hypothetical protein